MRLALENRRKSIYINNLGRAGRGGVDVSPLVARVYVDLYYSIKKPPCITTFQDSLSLKLKVSKHEGEGLGKIGH